MARDLLLRGMLAGLLAGLLTFAVASLLGEPPLELAIGFEAAREHAHDHATEPELVSRAMQRATVDFPEPDSPTTPSVCPSLTSRSMPSTALMWPTVRLRKPRRIGNHTRRSLASRIVSAFGSKVGGVPFGSEASKCLV